MLLHATHAITGLGGERLAQVWLFTAIEAGAVGLCLARTLLLREERLAWALLTAYVFLLAVGDGLWSFWLNGLDEAPFPSVADAAYIAGYLCAYAGQGVLLFARLRPLRASLWLDGIVAGLGFAALVAALAFGPIVDATSGSALTVATTLAYPVCDALLLVSVGVAFALTGWRPGRAWTFLGISLVVTAIADIAWSYMEASGTYRPGTLIDTLWPAGLTLVGLAAWQPPVHRAVKAQGATAIAVPAAFAFVALGILVWSQWHEVPRAAAVLAAASLAAAGLRALVTSRENVALLHDSRREALSDGLTALGNRRRLMDDLEDALAEARHGEPSTLVFFDLDGFKGYNDAFGHSAGDALLTRLGRRLEAAVRDAGRAYRLGGDEFCVLLRGGAARDDAIVELAAAALTESGEGFVIGASYGTVGLPADADSGTLALQLGDERMYAHKGSRRASTKRQARDLLLAVLKEREPALEQHMGEVAALAVAVGRRLGLAEEQLDEVARGAELHDVGKIAIPDGVLHKPAALDDVEWQLMSQHTVIGERIIAAAPALRPVARLVRSSHERWDGSGYPDALAGDAIPLGARIISVCDAYDAMRTARPYAAAVAPEAALLELRRCAGTQFDPQVVEAFVAVVHELAAEQPPAVRHAA